mmetsp:Transcript_20865/g.30887  ORF Transcript_20865/g.30887 Transcript_20865/m.30887 type:complete len:133 (-) Transcript_20865:82-480(-)|eukprot:CAMPEP_0194205024 /NCGR_PEP_ID=MMETSP0156-20130528/4384_1 /TAXON_ID=33649 /ORGANISM="Thalassionema nitzschioides, Strain L26-B" /LENGTH=132 /DNA_ID=CAMNT_0038931175 /DNA_START=38 /DNA_END=436 /DNA_ORIENTATION=-
MNASVGLEKKKRASYMTLSGRGKVAHSLPLLKVEEIRNDASKNEKKNMHSTLVQKIATEKFGGVADKGSRKISTVQIRKEELEHREREENHLSDPRTQMKKGWVNASGEGKYRKTLLHEKGVRSKRALADLP